MALRSPFALPPELLETGLLPSPPSVVVELMRITNDPESDVEDIGRVIERDAVLSARLLGLVNSGLYTLVREIHSINDAAVLVGFKAIRALAVGASIADGMPTPKHCAEFDLARYWSQSLMTAILSRKLADRISARLGDEAFTIGLIADLGRLTLAHSIPDRYGKLLRHFPWPTADQEIAAIGYSSSMVGAGLLDLWELPHDLCYAVLCFENPDLIPDDVDPLTREATDIASVASTASTLLLGGGGLGEDDDVGLTLSLSLGIEQTLAHQALEEAGDGIGTVKHMISSSLPSTVNPMELLGQAKDLFQSV